MDFKPHFQTFMLLGKITIIISRCKIRAEELGWIIEHAAGLSWLDLSTLPFGPNRFSPSSLDAWERLVDVFTLLGKLPSLRDKLSSDEWQKLRAPFGLSNDAALPSEPALLVIFDLAAKFNGANAADAEVQLLQILGERTGWNKEDLAFLVGDHGF